MGSKLDARVQRMEPRTTENYGRAHVLIRGWSTRAHLDFRIVMDHVPAIFPVWDGCVERGYPTPACRGMLAVTGLQMKRTKELYSGTYN